MSTLADRVGTSIVQPVNSSGKCRKMPARQILQKSLKWQILAFMNIIKLKTCKIKKKNLLLLRYTGDNNVIITVKCHKFCMVVRLKSLMGNKVTRYL